jgi:hypothetical protein
MGMFDNLSPEEKKLLISLGFQTLGYVGDIFKTFRAKGVDLEKLMELARNNNKLTIDDILNQEKENG